MSKMSELHAEVTEMVESGIDLGNVIEFMVSAGYPREACPFIIAEIAGDIETETTFI